MSSNDTNATARRPSTTIIAPFPPDLPKLPATAFYTNRKQLDLTECKWASAYPEIQKACYLSRVSATISPRACRLKDIQPILQEGPTCGLAAISMLLKGNPSSDELLQIARHKKFTRNGEMFSADNLFALIEDVLGRRHLTARTLLAVQLFKGRIYCETIKQVLLNGGCLLVPYDPDFNHGPCLKNGHKAHWALIIGYLIDDNNRFYVFSRHGKTKNIAIWPLKALSASNTNLIEFEQPKGYPDAEFILPVGGLGGEFGLKNKCIIIEGVTAMDIVVR